MTCSYAGLLCKQPSRETYEHTMLGLEFGYFNFSINRTIVDVR